MRTWGTSVIINRTQGNAARNNGTFCYHNDSPPLLANEAGGKVVFAIKSVREFTNDKELREAAFFLVSPSCSHKCLSPMVK
jgi:hypothetical protein